jgi:3-methyladenine DNA glycosylase AlkD
MELRGRLEQASDSKFAAYHQAYHKSSQDFYGLRAPQLQAIFGEFFPARKPIDRDLLMPLIAELRASNWAEEVSLATMLLERIQPQLTTADVPFLRAWVDGCQGWGSTDTVSVNVISPLALRLRESIYKPVRGWSEAEHMWTRRASILVHIVPARRGQLSDEYSWPTFDELLHEKEFFIRKAIGWTLRECSRHYPEAVAEFLVRVGDRASGLTRREGGRNLPENLRNTVLPPKSKG